MTNKKLYKIETGKKISGVCGGIAEYFEIDPSLIRIIWALLCVWNGIGIIVYIIAAFILPTKSEVINEDKFIDGESSSYY